MEFEKDNMLQRLNSLYNSIYMNNMDYLENSQHFPIITV